MTNRGVQKVGRFVGRRVERELWARAAGRCEIDGCNVLLYRSPLTQEALHIAEKAHIYSFAPGGPRGHGPLAANGSELNGIENLILVCTSCHKLIDNDLAGSKYSATLLQTWKQRHEERIQMVTAIAASKKSHVLLYGSNIGAQTSPLQPVLAQETLFPQRYPSESKPVKLAMRWNGNEREAEFWSTEELNLVSQFDRHVRPLLDEDNCHLSVFALAPMPLLIRLGSLLTDKISADVYQLHREPPGWRWRSDGDEHPFILRRPVGKLHRPVLAISVSAPIPIERINRAVGVVSSVWELTVANPHNDVLRTQSQLAHFRVMARQAIAEIARCHGSDSPIAILPAMPVACAVELGRIRMPKADSEWALFDFDNRTSAFNHVMTIGSSLT